MERNRRAVAVLVAGAAVALAGCSQLERIPSSPPTTPAQWCAQRPCLRVGGLVVNEPLGTFLVFALAALWVGAGVWLWRIRAGQRSRTWLGIALVLGGIGAALAGTSYQAFSYELKCAGRAVCVWTTWFEVAYMVCQAASVSAMLTAVAFACTTGTPRRVLIGGAIADTALYLVVAVVGATVPVKTLLSFDVLVLFALPGLVAVLAISAWRYRRERDAMDLALVGAAVWLVVTFVAYFGWYSAGVTQALWRHGKGFYLSENDILHVGMIVWLVYLLAVVARRLHDVDTLA